MKLQRRRSRALQPPKARLYILCLFFAAGILAGFLVRCALPVDDLSALSGYVTSYAQLAAQEKDAPALLQIVWAYVRYPAAVFLLGFTAWGVLFIPLVCDSKAPFVSRLTKKDGNDLITRILRMRTLTEDVPACCHSITVQAAGAGILT